MREFQRICIILISVFISKVAQAQTSFDIVFTPSQGFCINQSSNTIAVSIINSPTATVITSYSWTVGHPACPLATVMPNTPSGSNATVLFPQYSFCCGIWLVDCAGYDTNNNYVGTCHGTYTLYCSPNVGVFTSGASTNSTLCSGTPITFSVSGAQTYTLNGPGISSQITSSATLSPSITSCYSITGSSTLGCSSEVVKCFTVTNCVSIEDGKESITLINLYPNPAQDLLYLILDQRNKPTNFTIYNSSGERIFEESIILNGTEDKTISIKTSDLRDGIYFLQLKRVDHTAVSRRFVIAR